uniref:Uncharacterized protein n=1 Tax=Peromyscus maniculatus bairdii TaxID=230844 RepID=A0A8C9CRX6_PERMB
VDSRFPDFRSPVTLKSLSRCGRNSGGRWFVFFKFGTVDLAVSKEATSHQALPPALYWELEDPSFCPDPQSDAESKNLACRPGTWIFVHGDSCHLTTEEDTIPVDHCDPRSIRPS